MTNSESKAQKVIVGVDTHKYVHIAVAIDTRGTRLGDHAFFGECGGLSGPENRLGRVIAQVCIADLDLHGLAVVVH